MGAHPKLAIELVGPQLRISALASLQLGDVLCEPLTPFLNLLPTTGQPLALARLVATLSALKASVHALQRVYADTPPSPAIAGDSALPHPLACGGFTQSSHLGNGRLLWSALDAAGRRVCVKFTPHAYGEAVHKAWAAQGLAPELHSVSLLPGGLRMVVMELLPAPEWAPLDLEDGGALDAALAALRKAHAVELACGGCAAHGDCRPGNVLMRRAGGGGWEVRFVDFC